MTNNQFSRPDRRRVAVIGVGAVTSMGPTAIDLWQGVGDGRVAIEPVLNLDMRGFQTKLGGEVSTLATPTVCNGPGKVSGAGAVRERALELATSAALEALTKLGDGVPQDRIGLVLGTCNAGLISAREWLRRDLANESADPLLAQMVTPGGLADALAGILGIAGPVLAVNTACASGANAIGMGADLIRTGRAEAVLAGGTDALSDVVFAGFTALQALSPIPAAPYSGNRQGLSLGEGSGMLLLMSSALAEQLALPALAEVAGYGLSADGYHSTAPRPDGSGAAQAIRSALRLSGVHPIEVGYINGHGTGTLKNDSAESRAIQLAFGGATNNLLVSSTKSMIGHLLGAAGAVEAIVTIGALAEQIAPPTAGFVVPDPDCPLDYVPNESRLINTDVALSNNFGFGGANACLALSRPRSRSAQPAVDTEDVVVTGISVLSPAGTEVADAWNAYRDGRHVHQLVDGLQQGLVTVDPAPYIGRRERRRMDRLGVLSVVSTAKALAGAGLTPNTNEVANCGVIFGTGVGPMEAMERFIHPMLTDPTAPGDPGVFPNTVYNQAAGQVALHLGLYGPTSTLSVGHATGAVTVGYAADLISAGHADLVVATVTDVLTPVVARAYAANRLVSNGLDRDSDDGLFALAEGSVSLVLEKMSTALRRGARPLGTIAGFGMSSDGSPMRGVIGASNARAIRAAIDAAGLRPDDIGDVWLAAAGHRSTDRREMAIITGIFGLANFPTRHAPKTFLGEPMGVGGALVAALAINKWRNGHLAPALINTMSLTGSHAALVITPPRPSK